MKSLEERLSVLENYAKTYSLPENYLYSEEMCGIANGLLIADAIMKGQNPEYAEEKKMKKEKRNCRTRKIKPTEVCHWFKNGDHLKDDSRKITEPDNMEYLSEGKIVRRFRHPDISGESICNRCGMKMKEHGWIDNGKMDKEGLDVGLTVCPGDWVLYLEIENEYFVCSNEFFHAFFEIMGSANASESDVKNLKRQRDREVIPSCSECDKPDCLTHLQDYWGQLEDGIKKCKITKDDDVRRKRNAINAERIAACNKCDESDCLEHPKKQPGEGEIK